MKYKLLVLDVDGILVNSRGKVCRDNIKAIYKVVAKGVKVALSTGRTPGDCHRLLNGLKLNGCHIFFNGALVSYTDTNQRVYAQPIQPGTIRKMVNYLDSSGPLLELYTIDRFYNEIHSKGFGSGIHLIEDLSYISSNKDILKIETIAKTEAELEKANLLKKQFTEELKFSIVRSPAFPGTHLINISDSGVSKGNALKKLAAHLEIPLDQVVAVGHKPNDISMIETAGLGIATDDALPRVKAAADHIIPNEGGVAMVIERYLLQH
jgi:Cof subfamily protein (haloacid dehalogenase superfamily)